jgi:hypothetical protein
MSLGQRTEIRKCGKPYATELDARMSKRGQQDGAVFEECWVPGCGAWHVRTPKTAAWHPPQVSDTGPDRKTRLLVLERDGHACVCCGISVIGQVYSLQHRQRRSQGGNSCAANLLVVLGDGTRGHHARIDSRIDPEDEAKGYTVRSRMDPHLVSVMVFTSPGGSGVTQYPTCDGGWSSAPAEVSA